MATQTHITMVDDIDGSSEDVITCAFGLGPNQYEIDLGADNREELENVLAKFVEHARLVRPERPVRRKAARPEPAANDRQRTQDIRAWAADQGMQVSARGRISAEVREAYEAAH